jgi:hypothetical protein
MLVKNYVNGQKNICCSASPGVVFQDIIIYFIQKESSS